MGPRNHVLGGGLDVQRDGYFGAHTWTCLGKLAVDVFNVIGKEQHVTLRPLATVNVSACLLVVALLMWLA